MLRGSLLLLGVLLGLAGVERPCAGADPELARYDAALPPAARRHWAFQPVRAQPVPAVHDPGWVRNPIDAFVLARLETRHWHPTAPAEPRALLRRIYLDLAGLPPTPEEQDAFLQNPSPEALDHEVERLLAAPAYGERWARHWLDLVRYADTNGYERDGDKPGVWRYRDYVIRAFQADKPYDRFVLEQLAGDELPDADPESILATGFCRLGPWDDEPADPRADQFDQLDDLVATTSGVFLGLTLACARCHNHKFEPLTMHDYYRMVAVFRPLERPRNGRTELDLPAVPRPARDALARRDRHIIELRCGQAALGPASTGLPLAALGPAAALEHAVRRLREEMPDVTRGYFLEERSPRAPATHLLTRGQAARPGPEVAPGVPAVLVARQPDFLPPGEHTSRRRLSLARWITRPDNPLTARVIVNWVWQEHFGEGLVRTPGDFGTHGEAPTHPELLDYLADRFVRAGWSFKQLHRLILASNTYRMAKRWDPAYGPRDPENRLWWRLPYRRLEAEAIRDSMLAASGRLNRSLYGPSVYPRVPREALEGHSDPDQVWKPFDEARASRRTLYAHVKRSLVLPLLEVLDFCDTARSAPRRTVTTVAPQALTLYNGEFVNRQAHHLADRLRAEAGPDPARQIDLAYSLVLCRPPSPRERAVWREVLAAEDKGREQMARVLFNLNEFVYTD